MRLKYSYTIKLYAVIVLLLAAMSVKAIAQYEDIRSPQKPEEVALFKKTKIMGESQYGLDSGKKVPYLTRAFDSAGRVVIAQDYSHIKYYMYDSKGNVTDYLDSARNDSGHFKVIEYKFKYDNNGIPTALTGPDFKSDFVYNADKRILTEKLVKDDTLRKNKYFYDKKGRLKEAFFYSPSFTRTAHILRNLSENGRINNECSVQLSGTSTDSTLEIYEYNDKNQLEKKQLFRFIVFRYSSPGSSHLDRSASHYSTATFEYNLDSAGRPLAEQYAVKDDKLNHSFSTWEYDKNGLITKETYSYAGSLPKTTFHDYYYFGK